MIHNEYKEVSGSVLNSGAKKSTLRLPSMNDNISMERLLECYNSDMQRKLVAGKNTIEDSVLCHDIPTLNRVKKEIGEEKTLMWIKKQIADISDYINIEYGLRDEQIEEMAGFILGAYYYLNIAEICFFVGRFKLGDYLCDYNISGPLVVMVAIKNFVNRRFDELARIEREQRSIEMCYSIEKRKKEALSYDEYKKIKEQDDIARKMPENGI